MVVEHMGRKFDGDAGAPQLSGTLIVVSLSSSVVVEIVGFDGFVVQSWQVCFESFGEVFDHFSVDSSRVGRCSSHKLVDGVVEFLHREWLHRVLVLLLIVLVFVIVFLRR